MNDDHTSAPEMTAEEAIQMVLKRPEMYGLQKVPTVPDAAPDGQVVIPIARIHELRAAKDAALAAVERCRRVLASWKSVQASNREHFESGNPGMIVPIDCVGGLSAALDGAPEPEEQK